MFDILKKAHVLPADIARILNINRVTASNWVNGHSEPHSLLQRRVDRILTAVAHAIKVGTLPVSEDVPRRNRHAEVAKAIRRAAEALKLGSVSE